MSGGEYLYAYQKVLDFVDDMRHPDDPVRAAFADHLRLVAEAMRAVEWVDSGDMGPGDEHRAILAVLRGSGDC